VYSNDGLSRNYGTSASPRYPEAAYGFQRFAAKVGKTNLVGFDQLNPQLQERVIKMNGRGGRDWDDDDRARTHSRGKRAAKGARNSSARSIDQ
jgi:hypothetical protein